ncbi:hypothetical protein A0H81_11247 [Grifola frondosa]|uniref:Uncharacterized protein n=1 Tax=Grifola frondosa TaxID=5627 RepID=A0A1C7LVY7_GRIFR|nr:hypothetical protein A0H81_11247 [Grifola frondosa]
MYRNRFASFESCLRHLYEPYTEIGQVSDFPAAACRTSEDRKAIISSARVHYQFFLALQPPNNGSQCGAEYTDAGSRR